MHTSLVAHQAGAYPSYYKIHRTAERIQIFLPLPAHFCPFLCVYVLLNEGRLKFLRQSLVHTEDCMIMGKTFR